MEHPEGYEADILAESTLRLLALPFSDRPGYQERFGVHAPTRLLLTGEQSEDFKAKWLTSCFSDETQAMYRYLKFMNGDGHDRRAP